ncbi:hypothetical protein HMPREF1548_03293 [Clostridium sp. KLE 1755]|nr:hypothetical protein HMPREF1548_03293 [Clostridium sp. KLE 1755]
MQIQTSLQCLSIAHQDYIIQFRVTVKLMRISPFYPNPAC